ncbi:phosphoglycerate mutase family protein [Nakamurella silvestris]|nr:phosphoglycerate mutase family protein [Nakamurella silvestris]
MRIIIVRHGESIGNVDESAFTRIPDHAMELTPRGAEQSISAGHQLRALLGEDPVEVFVSPYLRTWQTYELLDLGPNVVRVREEPRLREQDWGNLQDPVEQVTQRAERDVFGHFFYRLHSGESGADVYDRVSGFLAATLADGRAMRGYPPEVNRRTLLFVTHGLTMRLAAMSLMQWRVAEFEALSNPDNAEFRVLERDAEGDWSLDIPFERWK